MAFTDLHEISDMFAGLSVFDTRVTDDTPRGWSAHRDPTRPRTDEERAEMARYDRWYRTTARYKELLVERRPRRRAQAVERRKTPQYRAYLERSKTHRAVKASAWAKANHERKLEIQRRYDARRRAAERSTPEAAARREARAAQKAAWAAARAAKAAAKAKARADRREAARLRGLERARRYRERPGVREHQRAYSKAYKAKRLDAKRTDDGHVVDGAFERGGEAHAV